MSAAILMARAQMGFTLAFHIIFPTLNIGLAVFLAFLEALWLVTKSEIYFHIYHFWLKIFGLAFAVGVVSGVVLSYEFGTTFGPFAQSAGPIIGPLMTYEVLTAFFLESGFLGIMLFGRKRVPPGIYFFATCMVALGSVLSAFWIMSANSWMQTPAGYVMHDGQFQISNWVAALFNPSFPYRVTHMLMASMDSVCFVVTGVAAWYLVRGEHRELARKMFALALGMAVLIAPLQVFACDENGEEVGENQPMKLAAIEAIWNTHHDVAFNLFVIPDPSAAKNVFQIQIPRLASIIDTRSWNGEIKGLKTVKPEDRPNVAIVFYSFRVMAGIGFLLWFVAWLSLWLRWRRRLYKTRWYLGLCILTTPLGLVATVAGWVTAECGRQPWVVQGLMRTADGASAIPVPQLATSLALLVFFYGSIMLAFLYFAGRIVLRGPDLKAEPPSRRNVLRHRPAPAE